MAFKLVSEEKTREESSCDECYSQQSKKCTFIERFEYAQCLAGKI